MIKQLTSLKPFALFYFLFFTFYFLQTKEPAGKIHPAGSNHQLQTTNPPASFLSSVNCHLSSFFANHQPPTTNYKPPTTNY
jgi:hypothetical protein